MPSYYHFKEFYNRKSISSSSKVFINYLNCFFPYLNESFKAQTVKDFILWMVHDLDYRINKRAYIHFLLDELQPYFRHIHQTSEFEELKKSLSYQVLNIDSRQEFFSALESWYTQNSSFKDIRIIPFQDRHALVLNLKKDGSLSVFVHSSVFVIEKGILTPLPPLTRLFYNHQFDLDTSKVHFVFHPPHGFFRVQFFSGLPEVQKLRFPLCTPVETSKRETLESYPELYSEIKKAENCFIQPKSDPAYQKLIQSLQNGYQLLLINHPHGVREARSGLEKAKEALKNYYSNDRLILLLVANIEYHLNQKTQQAGAFFTGQSAEEKDPFIQTANSSDSF